MLCHALFWHALSCSAPFCHAMFCHALFCHALLRSVLFVEGEGGGPPGNLAGLGDLAAAVCRAGGPGCLVSKSNGPNLSGGEQVCYVMICCAMLCSVVLCSVMRCSVVVCDVLSCSVLSCHVVSCSVLACFVMLCGVLSCHVLSCTVLSCSAPFRPVRRRRGGDHQGFSPDRGIWRPRYVGRAGRDACS